MRQTERILLREGSTGQPFSAGLIEGVTLSEMQTADQQWIPFLTQAVTDALARGVPRYDLPEHKHWEWERKARAMTQGSMAFAIQADAEMQALMIVRTDRVCRIPSQTGEPLAYVDYLAAAPWNLPGLVVTPRFTRCGITLIDAAIRYSARLGFAGRIGLHALNGAEGFYRDKIRMRDLGIDVAYEDLRYFEMTESDTTAFLSGRSIS